MPRRLLRPGLALVDPRAEARLPLAASESEAPDGLYYNQKKKVMFLLGMCMCVLTSEPESSESSFRFLLLAGTAFRSSSELEKSTYADISKEIKK